MKKHGHESDEHEGLVTRQENAMRRRYIVNLELSVLMAVGLVQGQAAVAQRSASAATPRSGPVSGSTTTRLADGRWLLVGGETSTSPLGTAWIFDPNTQTSMAL